MKIVFDERELIQLIDGSVLSRDTYRLGAESDIISRSFDQLVA